MFGAVVFNVGRTENFTNVRKADARQIVSIIRETLTQWRASNSGETAVADSKSDDDPIQQIRQLAELRDAGALSDDEFESLKQRLLNQL